MDLTFGIVTINSYQELNYEKQAIYDDATKHFKEVLLIDPREVSYQFIRGAKKPNVNYQGRNITNLSALHIRSFDNISTSTSILAHTLNICGCILNDPVYRFKSGYSSKLLTTVGRYVNKTGSSSFLAFTLESTLRLISTIENKKLFPLIVKPISGGQGKGIFLLKTVTEMQAYTNQFFQQRSNPDTPIFFQTYVTFVKEYRVFVIDRKIVGIVSKIKKKGEVVANAARGGVFIQDHNQAIVEFVIDNLSNGIYGADVAIDESGNIHMIEANVSPNWKVFQEVTGIDVAKVIIADTLRKIEEKKNHSN